ncbi:type III PLP-dependent enzyme domain-containing protein [Streptomonospora litoralis]|uniref:Uncharacterized protein n=1 Tax=Streptomonospora litoralis TaxID=2498135 RepID=A0A4P6Q1P1_9ACTN|nr:hypothetical protein [Streptomonospora litoralis]QBI52634.1 hypothetical protein EKD16_04120 [Streptomonospora litoralis]
MIELPKRVHEFVHRTGSGLFPLRVYDLPCIADQAHRLRASLPPGTDLRIPVRAPRSELLTVLAGHTSGFDVHRSEDLRTVRRACPGTRISLCGPGKSGDEIRRPPAWTRPLRWSAPTSSPPPRGSGCAASASRPRPSAARRSRTAAYGRAFAVVDGGEALGRNAGSPAAFAVASTDRTWSLPWPRPELAAELVTVACREGSDQRILVHDAVVDHLRVDDVLAFPAESGMSPTALPTRCVEG